MLSSVGDMSSSDWGRSQDFECHQHKDNQAEVSEIRAVDGITQ